MPKKLWLPNVEEVLPENDVNYGHVFVPKTFELFPRFLLCLAPGDAIVSPQRLDQDFCTYIAGISGLGGVRNWLIELDGQSKPYSLVESLMLDWGAMRRVRELAASDAWTIEPFIESPRIMRLSRETAIPTDKTNPQLVLNGVITKINDKGSFKELAKGLGVNTVGGYLADSMPALEKAIDLVSKENGDRVMLRKTLYGGGLGNLSGGRERLLYEIRGWYNGGRILIEPFLDIKHVAGSLAVIGPKGARFLGVDVQTFCDGRWSGFDFPHPEAAQAGRIKELTMLIAAKVHGLGARGSLNVDWAFTADKPGEPLALECNFRNNGFGYVLDFASRYFSVPPDKLFIRYREGLSCGSETTASLIMRLSGIKIGGHQLVITGPGRKEGAVLMTPPLKGKCSVALFSQDPAFIKEATAKLSEAGL